MCMSLSLCVKNPSISICMSLSVFKEPIYIHVYVSLSVKNPSIYICMSLCMSKEPIYIHVYDTICV